MFQCYENKNFYFFWKPHGIPSTFGKQKSFLDYLEEKNLDIESNIPNFIKNHLKWFTKIENIKETINNQINTFTREQEYGLLNRLDNETAGLLYFAKSMSTFGNYSQLQDQEKIEKYYIAQIQWKVSQLSIEYPIMHRSSLRMVAIKSHNDLKKWNWKKHNVKTFIEILDYDKKLNISTLKVTIHKGIRHQIRVHLASIHSSIIWDPLYGEKSDYLHLRSIWCEMRE